MPPFPATCLEENEQQRDSAGPGRNARALVDLPPEEGSGYLGPKISRDCQVEEGTREHDGKQNKGGGGGYTTKDKNGTRGPGSSRRGGGPFRAEERGKGTLC